MQLPHQIAGAQLWELYDFPRPAELVTPAAAGAGATLRKTFGPVPDDELWLIDRISVACDSTTATRFRLYQDEERAGATKLMDGTNAGNLAIADEYAPVQLPPSSVAFAVWENASVGAIGTARIQYRVYKRRSVVA